MNRFSPKNVLITGGAGFIGSNFIRYLLAVNKTVNVVNLDLLTEAGSLQNLLALDSKRHCFVQGNIGDSVLTESIMRNYRVDTIVHFAAESHVDKSIDDPALFVETNVRGTVCLAEVARQYWMSQFNLSADACRFYHISTDEVFGSLSDNAPPSQETDAYRPTSPYAASKAAADHLLQAFYKTYRFPLIFSYSANNYGPCQHYEKLIPKVITHCFHKNAIPIYGDGTNKRDWLYVEDHCRAIHVILHHGRVGETYSIASGSQLSNNELVRNICRLMDEYFPIEISYGSLITYVTDRLGHDFRYAMDITKIQKDLGWFPKISLNAGLRKTIQFYFEKNQAYSGHVALV